MTTQVLAESLSPNGNIEAFVEQDDHTAYFYLRALDGTSAASSVRACWVRNLRPTPPHLGVEEMGRGVAPMMPEGATTQPGGGCTLSPGQLRVVWFEEGDAAALLEGDSVLAIIPCWSGQGGFHGYARDCSAESPVAWPLRGDNVLLERVRTADAWWRSWDDGDPWKLVQEAGIEAVEAALGPHTHYYAIDGGQWPPRALLRCRWQDASVLVTCGMQLRPQPTVEQYAEDPRPLRRIELALAIADAELNRSPDRIMGWLSGQSKYPWHFYTWLGHLHTMPCDAFPRRFLGPAFDAVLLAHDPPGAPPIRFPDFRGDPVRVLWVQPITRAERELAESQGSSVLAGHLAAKGHDFVHRSRRSVA